MKKRLQIKVLFWIKYPMPLFKGSHSMHNFKVSKNVGTDSIPNCYLLF